MKSREFLQISIQKVKTALKEVIQEILFKQHSSSFKPNLKNINLIH